MGGLRTYGWINLGLMFVGLLGAVFGLLLILSKAQATLSACSGWEGDKDLIATFKLFVLAIGLGGIFSGFLACIAGTLGGAGSLAHETNCILASVGFVATVIPLAALLVILGFGIGSTIQGECASRKCNTLTGRCNKIGCSDRGSVRDCAGWCMNEYEYLCDDTPPLFLGLAIIFALVVLASIPSCFHGCGASCACPNQYFRFDDPWDGMGRDAGRVVGKPVY